MTNRQTDRQTDLRQLREKRKCLPSVLTYFRDGVYAGELVDCETGNVVDLDHEQMEAFAAIANACDAGLLDAAERGLEAEAAAGQDWDCRLNDENRDRLLRVAERYRATDTHTAVHQALRIIDTLTGKLTTLTAERDGYVNECKTKQILLDEVRTICGQFRAERDAAVAERDQAERLVELLDPLVDGDAPFPVNQIQLHIDVMGRIKARRLAQETNECER